MTTIEPTALPGVGRLYALASTGGRCLGVVRHLDGRRDLIVYDPADRDTAVLDVRLTGLEAARLGELLHTDEAGVPLVRLDRHGPDLMSVRTCVGAGSPWIGKTVADMNRRVGPGATTAAVARDGGLVVGPDAALVLRDGDVLVIVGTQDAAFAAVDPLLRP